jgi:(p)ppGpp synthase/HD superfamily hydrolase
MDRREPVPYNVLEQQRLRKEASHFLSSHVDVLLEYNPNKLEKKYWESVHALEDVTPKLDNNKITKAMNFARKAHEGQERKLTGAPYYIHPLQVATVANYLIAKEISSKRTVSTTDATLIALLHDTVEDAKDVETAKMFRAEITREFGRDVEEGVYALSKVRFESDRNRHTLKEPQYCEQIRDKNHKKPLLALDIIKAADNIVNLLDPIDIPGSFGMKKTFYQEQNRESFNILNPISIARSTGKQFTLYLNDTEKNRDAHEKYAKNKRKVIIKNTEENRIPRLFDSQGRQDLSILLKTAVDLSKQTLNEPFGLQAVLEAGIAR